MRSTYYESSRLMDDGEYYRDLEMWVRGHSMSLNLVPFERQGTVSYSHSIVTIVVSLAISEICNVKKWHDLENGAIR